MKYKPFKYMKSFVDKAFMFWHVDKTFLFIDIKKLKRIYFANSEKN